MEIPVNFTVSPSSQQGDVYGTEFVFVANLPVEYTSFAWSFGDNTTKYNSITASHVYNYPGIYTVGLSAWTNFGQMFVDAATVNVDYVYRDSVVFQQIPTSSGTPGRLSDVPFVVSLTSAKIDQPLSIVLQPFNTRSVPHYAIPEKWKFLTPRWKFVDAAEPSKILQGPLPLSTVPIYQDSRVVAVKAEASFYYVDDLSTGAGSGNECPLLITATLSTEGFSYPPESLIYPYAGYSNSEVARAVIAWQISDAIPTKLKVTENYLNDVYPLKWSGVPIPVMITCESDTSMLSSFSEAESVSAAVLSYPRTNELGSQYPVVLSLSSSAMHLVSGVHYTVDEYKPYFKATDEYGNIASGYVFTTITPSSALLALSGSSFVVTASTIAVNQLGGTSSFEFPVGYPIHSDVYISNPEKSNINKINIVSHSVSRCASVEYYKNLGILVEGSASFIKVPAISSTNLVNYTLSGTAAVYGMSFNPLKNVLYTCDVDQNLVSSYSSGSILTKTVQLSGLFGNEVLCPSCASIDRNGNVWISLFDDHKLIKFDSNLNYLLSAIPAPGVDNFISLDDTDPGLLTQEDTFLIEQDGSEIDMSATNPPVVETDMNNNVWACYPDAVNSLLVKFDSDGNELLKAQDFPGNSVPVSLAINASNGIWVACKNTNNIVCYDADGTFVSAVSSFLRPSYVAMDRSDNVWVVHGYDLCSVYNTTTSEISTWKVSALSREMTPIDEYTSQDVERSLNQDEIWGGLAVDVYDRVWIIDSLNNIVLGFPANDPYSLNSYNVLPTSDTQYVIKTGDSFVTNIPVDNSRSAQAGGDWTGNRWYQKYAGGYNAVPVRGHSTEFKVYDLDRSFQVAKTNETFDYAAYFKSLALPEILNQNTTLFEFLSAAGGDGNPLIESPGRVAYERIANFVANNGDYETAEIDNLLSFAQAMSVDSKTFGNNFPVAVNRLLNLFSVPKQQLRGVLNLETDVMKNIGPILTDTAMITADKYYFIKDRKYATYQLMYTNTVNLSSVYPISKIEIEGLRQPVLDNYYFFMYDDQNTDETKPFTGNLIDWNSPYTTISYNLSTNEEWYGDGGLVETMFNNLLTKELCVK
jgi:hypothetical protein